MSKEPNELDKLDEMSTIYEEQDKEQDKEKKPKLTINLPERGITKPEKIISKKSWIPKEKKEKKEVKPITPERKRKEYLQRFEDGNLLFGEDIPEEILENNKNIIREFRQCAKTIGLRAPMDDESYIIFKPKVEQQNQKVEKVSSQPQSTTLDLTDNELEEFLNLIDAGIVEVKNSPMEEISQLKDEDLLKQGLYYTIPIEKLLSNKGLLIMNPPVFIVPLDKSNFKTFTIQFKFLDGTLEYSSVQRIKSVPINGFVWRKDGDGFYIISNEEAKKPEENQIKHRGVDSRKYLHETTVTTKVIKYKDESITTELEVLKKQKSENYKNGIKKSLNGTFS